MSVILSFSGEKRKKKKPSYSVQGEGRLREFFSLPPPDREDSLTRKYKTLQRVEKFSNNNSLLPSQHFEVLLKGMQIASYARKDNILMHKFLLEILSSKNSDTLIRISKLTDKYNVGWCYSACGAIPNFRI